MKCLETSIQKIIKVNIQMLRRSHLRHQFGKRAPPGSTSHRDPKKEYRDDHRDFNIDENAKTPQRPAPAWKLPQLVNINKRCPPGVGGSAITSQSAAGKYNFEGFKLIGTAFRAHRQVQLRKENNNNHEDENKVDFIFHDQHCMVIPDAYPKSTFHFLILPRISVYPHLNSIADVTEKDIPLLRHVDSVSAEIVKSIFSCSKDIPSLARRGGNNHNISDEDEVLEKILATTDDGTKPIENNDGETRDVAKSTSSPSEKDLLLDWLLRPRTPVSHLHPISKLRFMSGCHVLPSLCPLHVHLTSLDMQSDCLKNKKHYNTFTTGFFISRTRIEEEVAKHRYVRFALDHDELGIAERLENQSPMICAWCQFQCKSMPELKKHLLECKSNGSYFVQNTTLASR